VQWAVIHPAESIDASERYTLRTGGEAPIGLAGPGAPLVAEFCVAEFAAAVGLGPEAGKYYLAHALELRYRLPRLWEQVLTGTVQAWRARRIADATIESRAVDGGGGVRGPARGGGGGEAAAVPDRALVDEAVARFMPEQAEAERKKAADGRHFTIDTDQVSFAGTAVITGELDLADALDLDDAIRGIAGELKDLGSTEGLDVRRSIAVGELARRQLALPLGEVSTGSTTGVTDRPSTTGRRRTTRTPCCTCTSRTPRCVASPSHRRRPRRPRRARPRRRLRGPRPPQGTHRPQGPRLRVPVVQQAGPSLRLRPHPTLG
jgi:hypothetical protein